MLCHLFWTLSVLQEDIFFHWWSDSILRLACRICCRLGINTVCNSFPGPIWWSQLDSTLGCSDNWSSLWKQHWPFCQQRLQPCLGNFSCRTYSNGIESDWSDSWVPDISILCGKEIVYLSALWCKWVLRKLVVNSHFTCKHEWCYWPV